MESTVAVVLPYIKAAELEPGYFVFTVKTSALKGLDIPLGANPRKPSMRNRNVRAMVEQLEEAPEQFRRKNEGISIVAREAVIDEESQQIFFEMNERQGIMNGGHTYYALSQFGVPEATVRIEISTGVPDELTTEIASARNSSKKLSQESELHHAGLFEWVKASVSPQLRSKLCFFEGDEGSITVGELLQVANIANPVFPTTYNAKTSYERKGSILGSLRRHGMNASVIRVRKEMNKLWEVYEFIRKDNQLRSNFIPMIYEGDEIMYRGVALYILAGALQQNTMIGDKGLVVIEKTADELKQHILDKSPALNEKLMKLGQHFIGAVDAMISTDTFVDGLEISFLK
jgi:AIPR protein